MLVHVDDLIPDMRLEQDIKLKAGSFLITLNELPDGKLTEEVIASLRKFSSQLTPYTHKVQVIGDELVFEHLKGVLENDVKKTMDAILTGRDYPNFLVESGLEEKVRVIVIKLISNPDMIRNMYDLKVQARVVSLWGDYLLDHSIRVVVLCIAIGLKIQWSIIPLVNSGMAGVLHDMGILLTGVYSNLRKLDDYDDEELEEFVEEHQNNSVNIFKNQQLTMLPHTRNEIEHMLANHHRPDLADETHKTTILLYLAELVDEMVTAMPHKVRYNFTQVQKQELGKRYHGRVGLVILLLGLVKLFRDRGLVWEMVQALAQLFSMEELLVENYEEKLKKIIDFCPFNCAGLHPATGGNILPRTIYCKNSTDKEFYCEHLSRLQIQIQKSKGAMKSYFKCATLTGRLQILNESQRKGETRIGDSLPGGSENSLS
ncbi:MAG: hypothetical protein JXQ83_14460 [Candidatus Glassbacteria bacterium]|nr:hypothetical protein [Candidatus Glassbacteria bacterium]